jgi:hypothetical protein
LDTESCFVLIIVEGCDRTGKTTLVEELAVELGAETHHFKAPKSHPLEEYVGLLQDRAINDVPLVLDRGHIGESVWPHIFNRPSNYDDAARRYVELFMLSRGAVLVYCRRDYGEVVAACSADDEEVDGRVAEAVARFDDAVFATVLPTVTFDFKRMPEAKDRAVALARARSQRGTYLEAVTPRWVGAFDPKILLVGEQVGPAALRSGEWRLPFVPFPGTSGHFMLNDLDERTWREIALVNAFDPHGQPEPLPRLWRKLGYPSVVGLGRRAQEELSRQSVPHGKAPHPQYVRRFERQQGSGYMTHLIHEAAVNVT